MRIKTDSRRGITQNQMLVTVVIVLVGISGFYYVYMNFLKPAPFTIQIYQSEIDDVHPGQTCLLLATIQESGSGVGKGKPVEISVVVPRSSTVLENGLISEGQVAEISIIPSETVENSELMVTIQGKRGSYETSNTSLIHVGTTLGNGRNGEEDPLRLMATEIQEKFIIWLSENHPELGITSEVEWVGVNIRPNFMVVMYYLFVSEEWEMGMTWHVMIPPHDWSRIYLRSRFTEITPALAFELSSYTMEDFEIHSVSLGEAFAESIWR
jgi:hypothetical protein